MKVNFPQINEYFFKLQFFKNEEIKFKNSNDCFFHYKNKVY